MKIITFGLVWIAWKVEIKNGNGSLVFQSGFQQPNLSYHMIHMDNIDHMFDIIWPVESSIKCFTQIGWQVNHQI